MIKNPKLSKLFKTLYTHASNPWWWRMKGPKALGTILVNTSTNSRTPERILIKLFRQNVSLLFNQTCLNERLLPNHTHTHTHTHIYIHIYIYNQKTTILYEFPSSRGGCPRGIMIKVLDWGIVVSEFELKSRYYVHFWTNTLRKGINPLILPAMG